MSEATRPKHPLKLMGVIVDRGQGDRIAEVCQQMHIPFQFISLGTGTASSEILDYFGLGETQKELVLCLLPAPLVQPLQQTLLERFHLDRPGRGILFTIRLSSVMSAVSQTVNYLSTETCKEASAMEQTVRYDLIVTIVNQGFADQVMEAAKSAGATGGTVLNARGLGSKEAQEFLGISIRPEKELVMIIAKSEILQPIMKAISNMHGLRTDARGILFSLPVDSLIGIG